MIPWLTYRELSYALVAICVLFITAGILEWLFVNALKREGEEEL